jgi:hypothetical protein
MTYALRETVTQWTEPSTCDNAVTGLSQTPWNGGGALQFTPRTTPRVMVSNRGSGGQESSGLVMV